MAVFPIAISSIALIISLLTLFLNRLLPFRPRIVHSTPTFSLYKITPDISGDEKELEWWLPSFNVSVALYNIGKLPGRILDFRIVAKIKIKKEENILYFYPKWTVDYPKFQELNTKRFEWIAKSIKREWFPILLFADKEITEHIVLENPRWEKPFDGECVFTFEYISSKKEKWMQLNNYEFFISEDMFKNQSSYSPFDKNLQKFRNIEK